MFVRSICLYLPLFVGAIGSSFSLAQISNIETNGTKYSFVVDHNILNKEVIIEQPLIIPSYQITLRSIPTIETCITIDCKNPNREERKRFSSNQTWGGIFNAKQRFRTDLTPEELTYKLSDTIKGLDPILASKIAHLNILKKVKLKNRPKTWNAFVELMANIQDALEAADKNYNYNLYNQIINVHGYENGELLDYYQQNLCVKKIYECPAENIDIKKKLISQEEKKITINYLPKKENNSAFLFEHEKDTFEFIVKPGSNIPLVLANTAHNLYQINWDETSTNSDISFTITPSARKLVNLPDKFIHFNAENFKHGIFFEWRLAQNQLNTLLMQEKHNISIEYELCEILLGICRKKIRTKRFNLSTASISDKPSKNEVLLHRLTLGKNDLKKNALYKMKYTIKVTNSQFIASPKNNSKSLSIQYVPYAD